MGNKHSNVRTNDPPQSRDLPSEPGTKWEDQERYYGAKYNEMTRENTDYYIGSALRFIPDRRLEVDGDYLRKQMPHRTLPKKTSILDYLEGKISYYMDEKSKDDKYSCQYTIPTLVPGFPPIYNKDEVMDELIKRLKTRKNLTVIKSTKTEYTLILAWV
jgi:hypothetical protein